MRHSEKVSLWSYHLGICCLGGIGTGFGPRAGNEEEGKGHVCISLVTFWCLADSTLRSTGAGRVDPYCVDHPEYCIGGSLGSSYYTTNGTFNGSGIALATEFWNHEEFKVMTVYFQHYTGEIRSIQLTPKGEWIGGGASEVIVSDAKNATPISAVSYSINKTSLVSNLRNHSCWQALTRDHIVAHLLYFQRRVC